MQKALAQMNIQLANVISDVVGETGQRIIRAIVAGERDPHALAAMKHGRIRASQDEIASSLHGHWRTEHLFALKQALAHFDFHGEQLAECDRALQASLAQLHSHAGEPGPRKRRNRMRNAPQFDLRTQLYQMCGVDLTKIDGIDVTTALAVLSEIGTDLSRCSRARANAPQIAPPRKRSSSLQPRSAPVSPRSAPTFAARVRGWTKQRLSPQAPTSLPA